MLHLIDEPYDRVCAKIDYMMAHEPGIKEIFYNKRERLFCSALACLIKEDHNEIGFLNLVNENISNILFLDQGILRKYRGIGYGQESIKKLLLCSFNEYIIGETKKTNILANASAQKISKLVYETNDNNYYLFQKERNNEFLDSKEFYEMKKNIEKQKILINKRLNV